MTDSPPPMPPPLLISVIDAGSNAIRFAAAEALPGGGHRVLERWRRPTRLAEGLSTTGGLSPEAIGRSLDALREMRDRINELGISTVRAVATAAVRNAANGADFVKTARRLLGLELEVIPPSEEARLAYVSAAASHDLHAAPTALIDVGGASTEVLLCRPDGRVSFVPLPIGAVALTERFGGHRALRGDAYYDLRAFVHKAIDDAFDGNVPTKVRVIGSGGACKSLGKLAAKNRVRPDQTVCVATTDNVQRKLRNACTVEMGETLGLAPQRADIVVAGVGIVQSLLEKLRADHFVPHRGGLRDGLLRDLAQQANAAADASCAKAAHA